MRFVYRAFHGVYSDNPRAIYERLAAMGKAHHHTWLAHPAFRHTFPRGVTVASDPATGIAALAAADVLVVNGQLGPGWVKKTGALMMQTWHGTPLKRIHADGIRVTQEFLAKSAPEVALWDVLLSPNQASTARLRSAFRYRGPVLESGYPRNDILVSPGHDRVRARVRAALGLAEDATVVLYAPTWRDDDFRQKRAFDLSAIVDVDGFLRRLGEDHVLLLRLHPMVSDRVSTRLGPRVKDLSHHPDVRELYLAADVMVTDYSSTMFDFAVTGKPLIYFAHDLDHYRNELRGFYFDLLAEAPGPVVRTPGELFDVLADLNAVRREYADRYAAFRERYCHLEDGHSTQRVLDYLFTQRPQPGYKAWWWR